MADWAGMGIDVAGNAINSMINFGLNQWGADLNAKRNFKYNEMSADSADARQRAQYYDMYSPAAQVEQLKQAGLSPSLALANGMGSMGQAAGQQGGGANGIQGDGANYFNMFSGMQAMSQKNLQDSNAELARAQAENLQEQTKGLRGENQLGQQQLEKLTQEIEELKSKVELNNSQRDLNKEQKRKVAAETFALEFANNIMEGVGLSSYIDERLWQINTAYENWQIAINEKELKELEKEIKSKTKDEQINIIKQTLQNLIADTNLTDTQYKILNEEWERIQNRYINELVTDENGKTYSVPLYIDEWLQYRQTNISADVDLTELQWGELSDILQSSLAIIGMMFGRKVITKSTNKKRGKTAKSKGKK